MLAKLSTLAFLLPLASALSILPTQGTWASGNTVIIQWQATTSDPSSFTIELVNSAFNKQYALANNVPTVNGQTSILVPEVLVGDGYSLNFVANNNDQQVLASSGDFAVSTVTSTSATGSSTSSTSASTGSLASSSSASVSTPSVTGSSTVSTVPTVPTSSSSSAASASPTAFNSSGAASFKLAAVAPAAALVLSAVVGAVMAF